MQLMTFCFIFIHLLFVEVCRLARISQQEPLQSVRAE